MKAIKLWTAWYILSSHVEAANRRLDNWILERKPAHPHACPLCNGTMARDFRPSAHLEWKKCTRCGLSQEGVRVREAA